MTVVLIVVLPLVVLLYMLIAGINHGDHFAPQAYYRRKRGGAPVAYGYDSLVPRYRRRLPEESAESGRGPGEGGAAPAPHERLR